MGAASLPISEVVSDERLRASAQYIFRARFLFRKRARSGLYVAMICFPWTRGASLDELRCALSSHIVECHSPKFTAASALLDDTVIGNSSLSFFAWVEDYLCESHLHETLVLGEKASVDMRVLSSFPCHITALTLPRGEVSGNGRLNVASIFLYIFQLFVSASAS